MTRAWKWLAVLSVLITDPVWGQRPDFGLDLPDRAVPQRVSLTTGVPAGTRKTFADLEGPGCIRHIWITDSRDDDLTRNAILRIYFDGEETPHVEAPLRDFFGVLHGKAWYPVDTPLLSVQAKSGFNCYFPMPFAKSARVEIEAGSRNQRIYMQVGWHQYPEAELREKRRFCARWRREFPTQRYGEDYLMLDADGPGQLVGFVYGVRLIDNVDRWSHGGAENIYIDGDGDHPSYIRGIGGEDTFGTSYGGSIHVPESRLYASMPFYEQIDDGSARPSKLITGIRWFVEDTIPFERSIQVRFGCMQNDICSSVYWYQEGPVRPFFEMPPQEKRVVNYRQQEGELPRGTFDLPIPESGSWRLTGPIENKENSAIRKVADGEELDAADAESQVRQSQHGFVDFNHVWRPERRGVGVHHADVVGVARAVLESPREGTARLRLAWEDHLVLRVNGGEPIDLGHRNNFGQKVIEAPLKQGENVVEITLSNTQNFNHGGWAFAFQAMLPDGTVLLPKAE
jgi:hypothetical protein